MDKQLNFEEIEKQAVYDLEHAWIEILSKLMTCL